MDPQKLQRIAAGKNADGTAMFKRSHLSNIMARINQGRKNIFVAAEYVAGFALAKELFTPEYEIDMEYLAEHPEVAEAYSKAYPNRPPEDVRFEDPEQAAGMVNGVKGKLFEQKVAEKLNNGERVGDVELEEGQRAVLAESPTQKGYDLIIENEDGSVADYYQLKSTDSSSYANSAYQDNPDIEVIATSEAADGSEGIHDSSITDAEMTEQAEGIMDLDYLGDLDFVGGSFFGWAALRNGFKVATGKMSLQEGITETGKTMAKQAIAGGLGAAAEGLAMSFGIPPTGLIAAPISILSYGLLSFFEKQISKPHKEITKAPFIPEPVLLPNLSHREKLLKRYRIQ